MAAARRIFERGQDRIRLSRILVAVLVAVVLAGGGLVAPDAAHAASRPTTAGSAELEFIRLLNDERQARGHARLGVDVNLQADARQWSGHMARSGAISHTSTLEADMDASMPGWLRAGENVGKGWDAHSLHRAFLASPSHLANIVGDYTHVGVGVVYTGTHTYVTFRFGKATGGVATGSTAPEGDLWLSDSAGRVYAFGAADHKGDASALRLNAPVVGMASTPAGDGYWLLGGDGGVFSYGAARFHGSTGGLSLNRPVNGMAVTPSGRGYWLVASDGGIFSFGDAGFHGSAADGRLGAPTAGITGSPSGRGYWIVSTSGRVAAFGDAKWHGDLSGSRPSSPIVRVQATWDGGGYWLVAANGSVYPFGNAGTRVSAPLGVSGSIVAVARR